jgi:ADP-heptose:LPS heptosyltransferase
MARVLEPFGIVEGSPRYQLDPSGLAARVRRLESKLALERSGAKLLALHPFASKRNRCVSLEIWRAVAHTMSRRGFTVLWIGSTPELDELRSEQSAAEWRFIDRVGDGSLADTAAALSMSSLFAGHDSGPLHIAGAFGVPVLGVFAPGEPRRTFPQGMGEWRMIAKDSPSAVTASEMIEQLERLTPLRSSAS